MSVTRYRGVIAEPAARNVNTTGGRKGSILR
jgi:hypothetical protein